MRRVKENEKRKFVPDKTERKEGCFSGINRRKKKSQDLKEHVLSEE